MLAQLPATLDNAAKVDALIQLRVGDDVAAGCAKIESITLHILLSDPATETLPAKDKIDRVSINPFWDKPQLFTSPPSKGIEDCTEVRLNGVLLDKAVAKKGWLVYHPDAKLFAVGKNLIGILVTGRDAKGPPMTVEKVEMHVNYRS